MPTRFNLPKTAAFRVWIDLDNPKCVKEWCAVLEVSPKRLRDGVKGAGTTNGLHVRRWLERNLGRAD
jgi:hypothetical protein